MILHSDRGSQFTSATFHKVEKHELSAVLFQLSPEQRNRLAEFLKAMQE